MSGRFQGLAETGRAPVASIVEGYPVAGLSCVGETIAEVIATGTTTSRLRPMRQK